jgi:hypothetical protein
MDGNPIRHHILHRYYKSVHSLKLVKLDGFENQADEILFAERIGKVVTTEALILASSDGICLQGLTEVSTKQNGTHNLEAVAPLSCERKCSCKFVEVQDMKELYIKRVHMAL